MTAERDPLGASAAVALEALGLRAGERIAFVRRGCAEQSLEPGAVLAALAGLEEPTSLDRVALGDAITRLGAARPRAARVVEARRPRGMRMPEVAEALSTAPRTVEREWHAGTLWLRRGFGG